MLDIINNIKPFFEDCYLELGIREYSRILKISPPTASIILKELEKEEILKSREERRYILFRINKENNIAKQLSRIYWNIKLKKLTDYIEEKYLAEAIILFGSLSKLETKEDSDIDIAIITKSKKELNLSNFEEELKRKIQIFKFESIDQINKALKFNILNGYLVRGKI